jgi:VanZ family protein
MPDRPTAHVRIPPPQSDDFRRRMRMVHDRLSDSASSASQTSARWAPTLLMVALGIMAFFTLFPFNFTLHTGQTFNWQPIDLSDPFDWIMNVILTLPLGFALAAYTTRRRWRVSAAWQMFLLAGGVTCLCSTTVESLQLFLPSRVSVLSDILSNTTGGIVGCFCFLPFGLDFLRVLDHVARTLRRRLVGMRAVGALIVVVALVCAVPAWVLRRPRLANWNPDFPMLLGEENNMKVGDTRAWDGTVWALHIANRAASLDDAKKFFAVGNFTSIFGGSVIADYSLLGPGPYADSSHHLPNLAWMSQHPRIAAAAPAHFSYHDFLSTNARAAPLVRAIIDTDNFTIALVAAADHLDETGPARILTCSKNIYVRNFTLGQDNADLIIRLRTRAGGNNGTCPEWRVPGIFRDRNPHALLITYDGDVLHVYQDSTARHWRVRTPPEYSILRPILARDLLDMSITGIGNRRLVTLFYALCLLPIAGVLGLILAAAVSPPSSMNLPPHWQRLILPLLGGLFGVVAMYVTVDRLGVRAMGWTEFPLALCVLAIETAIFGHWWARGPARPRPQPPMAQILYIGDAP